MNKIVIDSNKKWYTINLKELFDYKDLFYTLSYRDFKVKYAQTFLGILWAFLKPALTLLVFILVFSKGIEVNTQGIPYSLFAICGISVWTYFSNVMSESGSSIISAQSMVQKIYFPRLIIPLSKALVGLIDLMITLTFLVLLMIFYGYPLSANAFLFPFFVLIAIISALGVGIWLSALTIRFRDFQQIVPFLVRSGMFITPVAYPASIIIDKIPDWAVVIYFLNPMAGVIEGMRWSILGGNVPSSYSFVSFSIIGILFVTSIFYFKKVEKVIADIV